jgi:hypothetical protein
MTVDSSFSHEKHYSVSENDTQEFSSMLNRINEHYFKYSGSHKMINDLAKKVLVEGIDSDYIQKYYDENNNPLDFDEKLKMDIDLVRSQYSYILEKSGLKIADSAKRTVRSYGQDIEMEKVDLQITDCDQFVWFVEQFADANPEYKEKEAMVDSLNSIYANAEDKILKHKVDDETIQAIIASSKLIDPLKKMDIVEKPIFDHLKGFSTAADNNYLTEYLMAKKNGTLLEPGVKGFWPNDLLVHNASLKVLSESWQEVVDLLEMLSINYDARDFYKKVLSSTKNHIDYALQSSGIVVGQECEDVDADCNRLLFEEILARIEKLSQS